MAKSLIGNIVVAAFLFFFVFINARAFHATGDFSYLLAAFNESLYVGFFLVRTRAVATSGSAYDWAIAFSATFFGTLLRPGHPFAPVPGMMLIALGTAIAIVSALYLNRSIGIVPAERRIKTAGIYRYVRHPMYAGELCTLFGYLLANISLANALIALGTAALMRVRMQREELFLSRNENYRAYAERTPWKLVPFVY
jgi:protein-S-isoprenylcysteine O-methyltransferase Ste14